MHFRKRYVPANDVGFVGDPTDNFLVIFRQHVPANDVEFVRIYFANEVIVVAFNQNSKQKNREANRNFFLDE